MNKDIYIKDLLFKYEYIWSENMTIYEDRPIRLVDVKNMINGKLVFVTSPPNLEYCIVSYTWNNNNKNPNSKYLFERLSPFDIDGLYFLAEICKNLKHDYLWIDGLCINQKENSIEKQREINNMGKYYKNATQCINFPNGLNIKCNIKNEILCNERLPKWFYRAWTLQEYCLGNKKIFIFDEKTNEILGYKCMSIPVVGTLIDTKHGKCLYITSSNLGILFKSITDQWLGEAPFKAPKKLWKDINRESAFMIEDNFNNKMCETYFNNNLDVIHRSMYRECLYEEDKIYCLLNLFNVKMEIKYGIGLENTLRNLAKKINSKDLSCLLLCNWYPEKETPLDLCSLPTFKKETTAICFNMINPISECNYIFNIGIKIYSKIIKCNIKILKLTSNNHIYDTISELNIQELIINDEFIGYGRILYNSMSAYLVKIGKFIRVNSFFDRCSGSE